VNTSVYTASRPLEERTEQSEQFAMYEQFGWARHASVGFWCARIGRSPVETLRHAGNLFAAPAGKVPHGSQMKAVMRY